MAQAGVEMDVNKVAETINYLVTSTAVVVGGTWAYFKFARGRTFKHRANLTVALELKKATRMRFLTGKASLKNDGLSKLPLNDDMKALKLFGLATAAPTGIEAASWELLSVIRLFEQHKWLEPQETVSDEFLFVLPMEDSGKVEPLAYQVEAIVGAKASTILRRRIRWRTREILVLSITDAEAAENQRATLSVEVRNGVSRTVREAGRGATEAGVGERRTPGEVRRGGREGTPEGD